MSNINGIAINTGINSHILDHIAAVSYILDIPLIVTEKKNIDYCYRLYPHIRIKPMENSHLCAETVREYQMLFQSTFWSPKEKLFYSIGRKDPLCFAYCPHGNSDKGYLRPMLEGIVHQDLVLLYGEHMKRRLMKQNYWNKISHWVVTGNMRYAYYEEHQEFFDEMVEKEIFSRFSQRQKTILYAPTWNDVESSSSFFFATKSLIEQVPSYYQLIIKVHPLLEELEPSRYYAALALAEKKKNVLILMDFPLIFPLLAKTDIYIGDFSSIGYDFLFFKRPMFFFEPHVSSISDRKSLHSCGITIPKNRYGDIFGFIEENLCSLSSYQTKQEKTFYDAFERNQSSSSIKQKIHRSFGDFLRKGGSS